MLRLSFVAAAVWIGTTAASHGALVHRYSFNGNVNDSIGGAHGTLVDDGDPSALFHDGKLDVSANVGYYSSSVGTQDADVQLPSAIIANAFNANIPGELTIEIWAQASENRDWAALFSAGEAPYPTASFPENYIQSSRTRPAPLIRSVLHRQGVHFLGKSTSIALRRCPQRSQRTWWWRFMSREFGPSLRSAIRADSRYTATETSLDLLSIQRIWTLI